MYSELDASREKKKGGGRERERERESFHVSESSSAR